jgi:hypothetical protein
VCPKPISSSAWKSKRYLCEQYCRTLSRIFSRSSGSKGQLKLLFEGEQLFEGGGYREPDVVPIDNTTIRRMVTLKKDIVSKENISNKM